MLVPHKCSFYQLNTTKNKSYVNNKIEHYIHFVQCIRHTSQFSHSLTRLNKQLTTLKILTRNSYKYAILGPEILIIVDGIDRLTYLWPIIALIPLQDAF